MTSQGVNFQLPSRGQFSAAVDMGYWRGSLLCWALHHHAVGVLLPTGWPTVSQKRFEAHSRTVVQDRADLPRSTQYDRRHFHVWPSSLEMTTLLPLHSQIVPSSVTSKAT